MLNIVRKLKLKYILLLLISLIICFYSVQIYFIIYNNLNTSSSGNYPIILWWTPFMAENERIINCFNKYSCLLTKNKSYKNNENLIGAYLFYGSALESFNLPLPKTRIIWAIFHEESPKNLAWFLYNETQNLFDITATFSRHSDFPITLQYLENLNMILDTKYYKSVEEKNRLLNDNNIAPVLYIQSDCDTPINRDNYIKNLMNYIKIDSFGKCLRNKEFPSELSEIYSLDLYNEKLMQFISKYKFIIAFENSICDDYITEKLWRPLIVGSIPIYLGSPTVEDWLPNNNNSAILVKNFAPNTKSLAEFINKINQNDTLYETFMEHKIKGVIRNNLLKTQLSKGMFGLDSDQEHPIPAFECFVCQKLHHQSTPNTIIKLKKSVYNCPKPPVDSDNNNNNNNWGSFWDLGKCQAKALKYFVEKGEKFTSEKFYEKWMKLYENNKC